jgi:hypothetical protein
MKTAERVADNKAQTEESEKVAARRPFSKQLGNGNLVVLLGILTCRARRETEHEFG